MKQFYFIIIGAICTIILGSCNVTKIVSIEVRQPAIISLPNDVRNVVIVDNTYMLNDSAYFDKNANTQIKYETRILTDSAKTSFINGFIQFMNDENFFDKVDFYSQRALDNISHDQDTLISLTQKQVKDICATTNADAVISVDRFLIYGTLEKFDDYYLSDASLLGLRAGTVLKTYSSEGMPLSKNIVHIDSLFWQGIATNSNIAEKLPNINDAAKELSIVTADNITKLFIPYWQKDLRWFYTNNSSEMKKAETLFLENNWKEAAIKWGEIFEDEKTKVEKQIRVASNIALANEYMDDIENALVWISIAYDLLPERSNSELAGQVMIYKKDLEKRIEDSYKVREQLRFNEE